MDTAGLWQAPTQTPLFRTAVRKTKQLGERGASAVDPCRMVKRRLEDAVLSERLSPHSFRVTSATSLLGQGIDVGGVHGHLGHDDPRTTRLYDRRQK
jgi:site-specific recombinase XerD